MMSGKALSKEKKNVKTARITPKEEVDNQLPIAPSIEKKRRKAGQSQIVNLRAPIQVVDDMDLWVEAGQYRSRSEFVLASIRFYLDYLEYKESYNNRTFERGADQDLPSARFEKLRYLRRR
jgi:Arc/MetJ-type ribon-helix-helix transcriptional regulator